MSLLWKCGQSVGLAVRLFSTFALTVITAFTVPTVAQAAWWEPSTPWNGQVWVYCFEDYVYQEDGLTITIDVTGIGSDSHGLSLDVSISDQTGYEIRWDDIDPRTQLQMGVGFGHAYEFTFGPDVLWRLHPGQIVISTHLEYLNGQSGDWTATAHPDASANFVLSAGDRPTPPPEVVPGETQAMWRLYNSNTGEHFYTASTSEHATLTSVGWTHEGVGWVAPLEGDPVYRLYNPNAPGGDHHYTMDRAEYDRLVSIGWIGEGVGWFSAGSAGTPLYRLYNPNATSGTHNYTASAEERDMLVSLGWIDEGIAWYGCK